MIEKLIHFATHAPDPPKGFTYRKPDRPKPTPTRELIDPIQHKHSDQGGAMAYSNRDLISLEKIAKDLAGGDLDVELDEAATSPKLREHVAFLRGRRMSNSMLGIEDREDGGAFMQIPADGGREWVDQDFEAVQLIAQDLERYWQAEADWRSDEAAEELVAWRWFYAGLMTAALEPSRMEQLVERCELRPL